MINKIIVYLIVLNFIYTSSQVPESKINDQSLKARISKIFYTEEPTNSTLVFELKQDEIDFFEQDFIKICKFNSVVLSMCRSLYNVFKTKNSKYIFTNCLRNTLNFITLQRKNSESSTYSSFEYFKSLEFFYRTLFFITEKKDHFPAHFLLFIKGKVISILSEINQNLSRYDQFRGKAAKFRKFFTVNKQSKFNDSKRFKLIYDFLYEYQVVKPINVNLSKSEASNIKDLLHICSNFSVRQFLKNAKNIKYYEQIFNNSYFPLSKEYQNLLFLESKITYLSFKLYTLLVQYLDVHFHELQKNLLNKKLIIPTLSRIDSFLELDSSMMMNDHKNNLSIIDPVCFSLIL